MKALAWDDGGKSSDPVKNYMGRLAGELARAGIYIEVEDDKSEFISKLGTQHYDFYVTDWFDERASRLPNGESTGAMLVNLIRRQDKEAPIFVISRLPEAIDERLLALGRPIFLKSKDASVPWMAYDIQETLQDLGLLVDKKRIFIIYGHDAKAAGTRQALEDWLRSKGVRPTLLESRKSRDGILPDLLREMQTCAAFIAICTPDDKCQAALDANSNWFQPRENVLFEMGMVFGLARGAQKLTVLQKWTDGRTEEQGRLPSDWGGYITMRFVDHVREKFPELEDRLRALGVAMP